MSPKILVPLDGSFQAYDALTYTLEQYIEPEVTMLHVTDLIDRFDDHPLHLMRESSTNGADEVLNEVQSLAADYDAGCTPVREIGQPSGVIISYGLITASNGAKHVTARTDVEVILSNGGETIAASAYRDIARWLPGNNRAKTPGSRAGENPCTCYC